MELRKLFGVPLQGHTFCHDDVFGMIGNIFSSAINAATQNRNTDKSIKAQREENEKYYQKALEQWNRENAYNAPSAAVQRLRDAGLNPALAYGTPNVSSPSPSPIATDVSAIANKRSVAGAAAGEILNSKYLNAVINNMNADTEVKEADAMKTGAEYEAQMTYNQYQDQILTGNLTEQKSRIELNASQTDLNDMKSKESYTMIQNIMASTNKMKADLDLLYAQVENVRADTAIKKIEGSMREGVLKAQMSHLYAQAKLAGVTAAKTQEEFNQLSAASVYNLLMKKESANNAMLQGVVLNNTANEIKVDIDMKSFDLQKKRGYEVLDDISKVCNTFSDVVGTITSVFPKLPKHTYKQYYDADGKLTKYTTQWSD